MHTNKKRLHGGELSENTDNPTEEKPSGLIDRAKSAFKGLTQSAQDKIVDSTTKQIIKKAGVTEELSPKNLRKYCILVDAEISASRVDPTGGLLNGIRGNILDNLPKDIYDNLKVGKTQEQMFMFFWNEHLFRKVWDRLGLKEDDLRSIVANEAAKVKRDGMSLLRY
jgi:hypothetical protein